MSKYTTILFDLDGTTADTDEVIVQLYYGLYDRYRGGNRSPREKIYYFSGPPVRETFKEEFPGQDFDTLYKYFQELGETVYPKYVKQFPNCNDMLRKLKTLGYRIGVVTNKARKATLMCLPLLDMENIFEVIVCPDDVVDKKPLAEPMFKAMKALGETDPSKVLYVGDNTMDYVFACNAGVDCMLVTWGPRKQDPNIKPKYRLDDFSHFLEVIDHE